METHCKNGNEYLCIISNGCGRKHILEKFYRANRSKNQRLIQGDKTAMPQSNVGAV
jgi:hypothetical protein